MDLIRLSPNQIPFALDHCCKASLRVRGYTSRLEQDCLVSTSVLKQNWRSEFQFFRKHKKFGPRLTQIKHAPNVRQPYGNRSATPCKTLFSEWLRRECSVCTQPAVRSTSGDDHNLRPMNSVAAFRGRIIMRPRDSIFKILGNFWLERNRCSSARLDG
jgi:hypothetical protein